MPDGWVHPARLELPTGHHLRPIRADDVDLDMCAVMGSQERLWSLLGGVHGWPPAALTVDQDRRELARLAAATARHESFAYALLDVGETELLGRLHVEPPRGAAIAGTDGTRGTGGADDADADVWWWVVDALVGGPVDAALTEAVPTWIARRWPLARPRFVGRDLPWAAWSALPDAPRPRTSVR
jgi:hypothetical protein